MIHSAISTDPTTFIIDCSVRTDVGLDERLYNKQASLDKARTDLFGQFFVPDMTRLVNRKQRRKAWSENVRKNKRIK